MLAAARFAKVPEIQAPGTDEIIPMVDLVRLRAAMAQRDEIVLTAAEAATGTGDLPYESIETFLIHLIAHDAHHRGQVVGPRAAGRSPHLEPLAKGVT